MLDEKTKQDIRTRIHQLSEVEADELIKVLDVISSTFTGFPPDKLDEFVTKMFDNVAEEIEKQFANMADKMNSFTSDKLKDFVKEETVGR